MLIFTSDNEVTRCVSGTFSCFTQGKGERRCGWSLWWKTHLSGGGGRGEPRAKKSGVSDIVVPQQGLVIFTETDLVQKEQRRGVAVVCLPKWQQGVRTAHSTLHLHSSESVCQPLPVLGWAYNNLMHKTSLLQKIRNVYHCFYRKR